MWAPLSVFNQYIWVSHLSPPRKDRCSTVQDHCQTALHLHPVQHWLHLPLEAGQDKRRPLWTVHVIQSEKGFESWAYQQAERCVCQSTAARAGNRAAYLPADVLVGLPRQLFVLVVKSRAAGVSAAEAGSGQSLLPPAPPPGQPRSQHFSASLHQGWSRFF